MTSFWRRLIEYFGLVRRDVESITAPIASIVDELHNHAEQALARKAEHDVEIAQHTAEAAYHAGQAEVATVRAGKIASLLG